MYQALRQLPPPYRVPLLLYACHGLSRQEIAEILQISRDGIHSLLDHGENFTSFYSYLEAALVKIGESVEGGQVIGLMGHTGLSTGAHLHFQIRQDGDPINLMEVLPKR